MTIQVKQNEVTGHWSVYVDNQEVVKAKTLLRCAKNFYGYIKGQNL